VDKLRSRQIANSAKNGQYLERDSRSSAWWALALAGWASFSLLFLFRGRWEWTSMAWQFITTAYTTAVLHSALETAQTTTTPSLLPW